MLDLQPISTTMLAEKQFLNLLSKTYLSQTIQ